jgi:hypothetical protein
MPQYLLTVVSTLSLHFFIFCWWGGTKSLGTLATSGLLYKPQMIDEDDCGAIGGMKIGRGNRSTRRKPAPTPLCPPQIPHDKTRARTPDRLCGKPATNRLSYGAAYDITYIISLQFRTLIVFTSMTIKSITFRDLTPCTMVVHFGRQYCLHHHSGRVRQVSNQYETGSDELLLDYATLHFRRQYSLITFT